MLKAERRDEKQERKKKRMHSLAGQLARRKPRITPLPTTHVVKKKSP